MTGLYNIVCLLITTIPMLAFIAAAFAIMAMLTIPKIQIGDWSKEGKKEEKKDDR